MSTTTTRLSYEEDLCLKAMLLIGERDGGDRFLHEAEEVAALTGLDEHYAVTPALKRLAELGAVSAYEAQAMPTRYRVWRPTATEILAIDPDASVIVSGPRVRLSNLAERAA